MATFGRRADRQIDPFSRELGVRGGTSVYVGLRIRAHSQKATDLTAREGGFDEHTHSSFHVDRLPRSGARALSGSALAITYRLTELTLGGTYGEGSAINASGQVTGWTSTADDAEGHAFLWNGTTMQDLGTLGGTFSQGYAINDSGQVAGRAYPAEGNPHAFLWDGTRMQDLGTLGGPGSEGVAINASGQVTGTVNGAAGTHAFLWDGTTMRDLGVADGLAGGFTVGRAINDAGQVTGYGQSVLNGELHLYAFLWDGTTMQDLGSLGGPVVLALQSTPRAR